MIQLSRTEAVTWLARARDFANTRAQEADTDIIKLLAESYALILEAKKIIAKIAGES